MDLGLRGAGPDGTPCDQVRDVLRGNRIQEFGSRGHPHVSEFEEQFTGDAEPPVDVEGAVKVRVIDQALPAHCGAGLFKVDPHDHEEVVAVLVGEFLEPLPVFDCGSGVVNRAGAHHHEEAVALAMEDVLSVLPRSGHQFGGLIGDGQVVGEDRGRNEWVYSGNAEVVCVGP